VLIDYHRRLVADSIRCEAFRRAIEQVIVPGVTRVGDLGSGTGWIGFMAHGLGAQSVSLYERVPSLAKVSVQIARRNGLNRIQVYPEDSRSIIDPGPHDLVVSETLGNLALEEGIGEILWDARRFLAPGGIRIPRQLTLYARPVSSGRYWAELDPWSTGALRLDFSRLVSLSRQNLYVRTFSEPDFACTPEAGAWDRVDFAMRFRTRREGHLEWMIERGFTLYGFAIWWEAELVPGIRLSTAPDAPPTHWEQIYAPVLNPVAVRAGDWIQLVIKSRFKDGRGVDFRWQVSTPAGSEHLSIRAGDLEKDPVVD